MSAVLSVIMVACHCKAWLYLLVFAESGLLLCFRFLMAHHALLTCNCHDNCCLCLYPPPPHSYVCIIDAKKQILATLFIPCLCLVSSNLCRCILGSSWLHLGLCLMCLMLCWCLGLQSTSATFLLHLFLHWCYARRYGMLTQQHKSGRDQGLRAIH